MNRRTAFLVVVVLLAHLVLISAQVNTESGGSVLQWLTFGVFAELQRGTSAVTGSGLGVWQRYVALRDLRSENDALKARLAALEVSLQQQRSLAARGERLEQVLQLRGQMKERTVPADVIGGDATAYFHTVTIGRGTNDGVQADMAVIASKGVVGRVIGSPSPRAARVQLLRDRYAAVGGLVERSRTGGVVVGDPEGFGLRMDYVSNLADIQPGDAVVTSGIEGIYPKGYVIGTVETVNKGAGLYLDVHIRTSVDFSALEEVLVVVDRPPIAADDAALANDGGEQP